MTSNQLQAIAEAVDAGKSFGQISAELAISIPEIRDAVHSEGLAYDYQKFRIPGMLPRKPGAGSKPQPLPLTETQVRTWIYKAQVREWYRHHMAEAAGISDASFARCLKRYGITFHRRLPRTFVRQLIRTAADDGLTLKEAALAAQVSAGYLRRSVEEHGLVWDVEIRRHLDARFFQS